MKRFSLFSGLLLVLILCAGMLTMGDAATPEATAATIPPPVFGPIVTSITPMAGPAGGGNSVVITGARLTNVTSVTFGTMNATTYVVDSSTQITALAPSGTSGTTVDVAVANAGGPSNRSSATKYSYGAPTVTSLTPIFGDAGGGTTVVIVGTGFSGVTAVMFGAVAASYTVDSPTQITATSPASTGWAPVEVTVTNPAGTSTTSGTGSDFTYTTTSTTSSSTSSSSTSSSTTTSTTTTTEFDTTSSTTTTTTTIFSTPTTTTTTTSIRPVSFVDVWSSPYRIAIESLGLAGIIGGYDDSTFRPLNPVFRAQFAKMIVLGLGLPVSEGGTALVFKDVERPADNLYPDDYVAVATFHSLVQGYPGGYFKPYVDISRAQLLTIVVRTAQRFTAAALLEPPAGWDGVLPATDSTHGGNIAVAEYSGLLYGIDLSGFSIYGKATRGEIAQIIWNLREK